MHLRGARKTIEALFENTFISKIILGGGKYSSILEERSAVADDDLDIFANFKAAEIEYLHLKNEISATEKHL